MKRVVLVEGATRLVGSFVRRLLERQRVVDPNAVDLEMRRLVEIEIHRRNETYLGYDDMAKCIENKVAAIGTKTRGATEILGMGW